MLLLNILIRTQFHFHFGVSDHFLGWKLYCTLIFGCLWTESSICLIVTLKHRLPPTLPHVASSFLSICKQLISPPRSVWNHYMASYFVLQWFCSFSFGYPMSHQTTTKKSGFLLVLMMKDYPLTKKVQVTFIIICASSFNPSGSSSFNSLRLIWITFRKV